MAWPRSPSSYMTEACLPDPSLGLLLLCQASVPHVPHLCDPCIHCPVTIALYKSSSQEPDDSKHSAFQLSTYHVLCACEGPDVTSPV